MTSQWVVGSFAALLMLFCWGLYYIEWDDARRHGRPMALRRHPLGVLAVACRRLWQFRSLALALVALWALSLVCDAVTINPITRQHALASAARAGLAPGAAAMPRLPGLALSSGVSLALTPPGLVLTASQVVGLAVRIGLIVWLLMWLWRRRDGSRLALVGPLLLLAADVLISAAALALRASGHTLFAPPSRLWTSLNVAGTLTDAPMAALVTYAILAVARGEAPDAAGAFRRLADTWLPVLCLYAILSVRALFGLLPYLTAGAPRFGSALLCVAPTLVVLLVPLALLFVKWSIVEHRFTFGQAWRHNFALLRHHLSDILVFVLRHALLFYPLWVVASYLGQPTHVGDAGDLGKLVSLPVGALGALMGAIWYLDLDRPQPSEGSATSRPAVAANPGRPPAVAVERRRRDSG